MKDKFGKECSEIQQKKLFLFDMDGTIYKDNCLFDGAVELMRRIEEFKGKYVFITNNSSKSLSEYMDKLLSLGIKVNESNFFTSAQATIMYLQENHYNEKVYCMGTNSFINDLKNNDIDITEEVSENASVVLIGFDTELTSDKIKKTCLMLNRNITYIATNPDLVCPTSFGYIPDCGAICNMIYYATNKLPAFLGKPNPVMVDYVRNKLGYSTEQTVVIGDRIYTDIAAGHNAGVETICVLTGEATIDQITNEQMKPTYTFNSIKDILEIIS